MTSKRFTVDLAGLLVLSASLVTLSGSLLLLLKAITTGGSTLGSFNAVLLELLFLLNAAVTVLVASEIVRLAERRAKDEGDVAKDLAKILELLRSLEERTNLIYEKLDQKTRATNVRPADISSTSGPGGSETRGEASGRKSGPAEAKEPEPSEDFIFWPYDPSILKLERYTRGSKKKSEEKKEEGK